MPEGRAEGHKMCGERVRIPQTTTHGFEFVLILDFRIADVNEHCLAEFKKHWQCLERQNHQLWQCRRFEWPLNKCVFDNLVSG